MENERQEREEQQAGSRGASVAGITAAMVRPNGDGLPHWGGKRPPRTGPTDVAGGPLPGREALPEKNQ